jgi:UDP-glucose 4-epimerase
MQAGYPVVAVDNLSNSHAGVADKVRDIVAAFYTARDGDASATPRLDFFELDILDEDGLASIFAHYALPYCRGQARSRIGGVIHFAALKAVSESISKPLSYYRTNITGLVNVLDAMDAANVKTLLYSSSATVYGSLTTAGQAQESLCRHRADAPAAPASPDLSKGLQGCAGITNPYGRTKWMGEAILQDVCASDPAWDITALRYFNPVGAHASGAIGEDPLDVPNNLMPCIIRVLDGRKSELQVYGTDYETADGTCIRDFIHVVDLARGHLAAIAKATERHPVVPGSSLPMQALQEALGSLPADLSPASSEHGHSSESSPSTDDGHFLSQSVSTSSLSDEHTPSSDSTSLTSPSTPASSRFEASAPVSPGKAAQPNDLRIFNLGTGAGVSVMEMVSAMREASGLPLPIVAAARRPGDVVISIADPIKAQQELDWKATKTLQDVCADTWHFLQTHACS